MPEKTPRVKVAARDDVTVAQLTDRKILDELTISQIGEQLNALAVRTRGPKLVLDFVNVSHMSSSALGMLITLHKRVRENDGQLRLCNIQAGIHDIFAITRLNEIFQIHPSLEAALGSLK